MAHNHFIPYFNFDLCWNFSFWSTPFALNCRILTEIQFRCLALLAFWSHILQFYLHRWRSLSVQSSTWLRLQVHMIWIFKYGTMLKLLFKCHLITNLKKKRRNAISYISNLNGNASVCSNNFMPIIFYSPKYFSESVLCDKYNTKFSMSPSTVNKRWFVFIHFDMNKIKNLKWFSSKQFWNEMKNEVNKSLECNRFDCIDQYSYVASSDFMCLQWILFKMGIHINLPRVDIDTYTHREAEKRTRNGVRE